MTPLVFRNHPQSRPGAASQCLSPSTPRQTKQVHYRHDDADAIHPDEAQQPPDTAPSSSSSPSSSAAFPTTGADGSPREWHAALALLDRAKAKGVDVHVTLRHACDGGDGFVVGVLAAHALAHGACRKGLKHAVPSIQRVLREARLHEARRGGRGGRVALAEVPNPAKPQPQVMAFAGWATVLGAWQARHVHRIWGGGARGWGDGGGDGDEGSEGEEEEEGEDRSHEFVVYVGDRFSAESREFLAHAGG